MNHILPIPMSSGNSSHVEADIIWDAMSVVSTQDSDPCATPTETSAAETSAAEPDPPAGSVSVSTSTSTSTTSPSSLFIVAKADSSRTEHYPRECCTFVIRSRSRSRDDDDDYDDRPRVIELRDGELLVVDEFMAGPGILWRCEKRNGWFGFCNMVSGTYMGHSGGSRHHLAKGFCASAKHHKADECFMAERVDGGGYLLLVKQGEALWQMGIGEDGVLETMEEGGTAWDFIEMGTVRVSL